MTTEIVEEWRKHKEIIIQFLRDLGGPIGQAPEKTLDRYAVALIARFAAAGYLITHVDKVKDE